MTSRAPRDVWLLALAQALMMSVNTLLITASAIIGFELASNKALATLPLAVQFCATMLTSIPASMMMGRYGRKPGFLFSSVIGLAGAATAMLAVNLHSFTLFCVATALFGIYTGFGNFFRFVAAEVAPPDQRNTAISYVLAGGVIAAVVGPNLANHSRDLLDTAYLGSFIAVAILYSLNLFNFIVMKLPRPVNPAINEFARPMRQIISSPYYIVALISAAIGFSMMTLLMTATPLAMKHEHLQFSDVAFVIQWHVLGMFAPSFITGHLMNRFGIERIIFSGALAMLACIFINLNGVSLWHFWLALVLLGVGWNFMFIGGTTLLTHSYNEAEKARAQAFNDFVVFTSVTCASLGAGALQYLLGWQMVNLSVIPFIVLSMLALGWLRLQKAVASSNA